MPTSTKRRAAKKSAARAPAKRSRGRPTKKSQSILNEILERIAAGEPLAEICRDAHMPGVTTVWEWEKEDEAFSESIARARAAGHDMIAAQWLRIADTPQIGKIKRFVRAENGEMVLFEERLEDMVEHRRLQCHAREKLLSKWDPKRYGNNQRVALGGDPDNPTPVPVGVIVVPEKQLRE